MKIEFFISGGKTRSMRNRTVAVPPVPRRRRVSPADSAASGEEGKTYKCVFAVSISCTIDRLFRHKTNLRERTDTGSLWQSRHLGKRTVKLPKWKKNRRNGNRTLDRSRLDSRLVITLTGVDVYVCTSQVPPSYEERRRR